MIAFSCGSNNLILIKTIGGKTSFSGLIWLFYQHAEAMGVQQEMFRCTHGDDGINFTSSDSIS